jgi:hypothetical protein
MRLFIQHFIANSEYLIGKHVLIGFCLPTVTNALPLRLIQKPWHHVQKPPEIQLAGA